MMVHVLAGAAGMRDIGDFLRDASGPLKAVGVIAGGAVVSYRIIKIILNLQGDIDERYEKQLEHYKEEMKRMELAHEAHRLRCDAEIQRLNQKVDELQAKIDRPPETRTRSTDR